MKNFYFILFFILIGCAKSSFAQGDVFLPGYSVNSLVRVNDSVILAGTDKGLWRYANGQWAVVPNLSTYIINDIAIATDNTVWIATNGRLVNGANTSYAQNGGVFLLATPLSNDTISWGSYLDASAPGGLTSRNVTSIELDAAQNVWTAHADHNLSSTSTTKVYGGLSFRKFNTAYTPLSTRTPFLQRNEAFDAPSACFPRRIEAVGRGSDTTVWTSVRKNFITTPCSGVSTDNVLYQYGQASNLLKKMTYDSFPVGSSTRLLLQSPNAFVRAIYTDKNKNTWFGFTNLTPGDTSRGILIRKFDGTWVHMRRLLLPTDASIMRNAIWEDNQGLTYVGTDKGLLVYKIENNDYLNPKFYAVYDMSNSGLLSNRVLTGYFEPGDSASYVGTDFGGFKITPYKKIIFGNVKTISFDNDFTNFQYANIQDADLTLLENNNVLSRGKPDRLGRVYFLDFDETKVERGKIYTVKIDYKSYSVSFNYPNDCRTSGICDTILFPIDIPTQLKSINDSLVTINLKTPDNFFNATSTNIEGYTTAKFIQNRWLKPYAVNSLEENSRKIDTLVSLLPIIQIINRNLNSFDKVNTHAIKLSYDIVDWFLDVLVLDKFGDNLKNLLDPQLNPVKNALKKMGEKLDFGTTRYFSQGSLFFDNDVISLSTIKFSMPKLISEALGKIGKEVDKKLDVQLVGSPQLGFSILNYREQSQDLLKSLINKNIAKDWFVGCYDNNFPNCEGTNNFFYQSIYNNSKFLVKRNEILPLIQKEKVLMNIFESENNIALDYMKELRDKGKGIKDLTRFTDPLDKALTVTYIIPTPATFLVSLLKLTALSLKFAPIVFYGASGIKTYSQYNSIYDNVSLTTKKVYNLRNNNLINEFDGINSDSVDIMLSSYNFALDKVKNSFLINATNDSISKNIINLIDRQNDLDSLLNILEYKIKLLKQSSTVLRDSVFDIKINNSFYIPKNKRTGMFLLSIAKLISKDSIDNGVFNDFYNDVKESNAHVSLAIDSLSNLFIGQPYSGLLISDYNTIPLIMKRGTTESVKIYYKNIGGTKAKNVILDQQ